MSPHNSPPSNFDQKRFRGSGLPGFTLIELLVAMGLLATVMSLIYTSFFQISGNVTRLNAELERRQEIRLILELIARDLSGAKYLKGFVGRTTNPSGIQAEKTFALGTDYSKLSFHTASPTRFFRKIPEEADPGLHEVGYLVEESEEDGEILLLKRREDFYLDNDIDDGGVTVLMLKGVGVFKVEFLSGGTSATAETWGLTWDSNRSTTKGKMPKAVRITLSLGKEDEEPELEVVEFNLPAAVGG